MSNGGNGFDGSGGSTSPTFASGFGIAGLSVGGFGGGDDRTTFFSGGGGGGYSGGGGAGVGATGLFGGGGGGSYVNPALRDVLKTPAINAGNGYVLVGTTYFGYTGSVEEYTIPTSAFYFVAAIGAQGGSQPNQGGDGAAVGGEAYLTQGTELDIVAGGLGADLGLSGGAGGGGGSFVWDPVAIPVQPVLESSTWAMLLIGFAGLGYTGWRAQRKTAALAA